MIDKNYQDLYTSISFLMQLGSSNKEMTDALIREGWVKRENVIKEYKKNYHCICDEQPLEDK